LDFYLGETKVGKRLAL